MREREESRRESRSLDSQLTVRDKVNASFALVPDQFQTRRSGNILPLNPNAFHHFIAPEPCRGRPWKGIEFVLGRRSRRERHPTFDARHRHRRDGGLGYPRRILEIRSSEFFLRDFSRNRSFCSRNQKDKIVDCPRDVFSFLIASRARRTIIGLCPPQWRNADCTFRIHFRREGRKFCGFTEMLLAESEMASHKIQ